MIVEHLSTSQFAGILDMEVPLTEGINVIYGKNESGKSTFVNLLSRTLFQRVRFDSRTVKDREFRELYFPSARKGNGGTGDYVDGRVTIGTEEGVYTLTKKWGEEPNNRLIMPSGAKLDQQQKIDTALREVLLYGEGVYADLLFSSQRNTDASLQAILDASVKTDAKQEIVNVVSQAFAESDGIAMDDIKQAIDDNIKRLAGKHWDAERGLPESKIGRWAKDRGEVLEAYYALEDAREHLRQISSLEEEVDRYTADYLKKDADICNAEDAYNKFNSLFGRLAVRTEKEKTVERLADDLRKYRELIAAWPKLEDTLRHARALQSEKESRELLDRYEAAQKIKLELEGLDRSLIEMPSPSREEIQTVRAAQREISTLTNRLSGMNLAAGLHMLGDHTVEIRSLCTGQPLDISDGDFAITEAVRITVPGVMELQLAPADVDVEQIGREICGKKEIVSAILGKYQVDSLETLEELAQKILEIRNQEDSITNRLQLALGGDTYQEIEAAAKRITAAVRSREAIASDVHSLCGAGQIDSYIVAAETKIEGYASEYGSIDELKAIADDTEKSLKKEREAIDSMEDIPDEYCDISDPQGYLNRLKDNRDTAREAKDKAFEKKLAATKELENCQSGLSEDPLVTVENAERIFEERQALLAHWQHIAEVFTQKKEEIAINPMRDIAESFTRNLRIISDGRISSEFPEADKLNMSIYSKDRLLDYGKLSEGTKETVSLAFRLAVLDHLFPEGGGIIVLDDPLTDMDEERAAQSCELIKDCATRHQVIFLTCRREYLDVLGGNVISL